MRRWALWFALLGGGVAWAVHLGGAWGISEFGCIAGMDHGVLVGLLVGLSVVTLGVAVLAAAMGWRRDDPGPGSPRRGAESARYMARAGWITSSVFAFIILFESIPIFFYLKGC